jgi:hypothetical protein
MKIFCAMEELHNRKVRGTVVFNTSPRAKDKTMAEQMTMSEVIRAIASMPADAKVKFDTGRNFHFPHSYRGDHEELAISGSDRPVTAEEALVRLGAIQGKEIGESMCIMTPETRVWHSEYGEVESLAIVGFKVTKKGNLKFLTEYQEW